MLITELYNHLPLPKKELDFDLHEDLIYFMNADPDFYRKTYFPIQNRFHSHCEAGRSVDPSAFKPIIIKAYENYKKKYNIDSLEEQLKEEELLEICQKLHNQELDYFDKQEKLREKK